MRPYERPQDLLYTPVFWRHSYHPDGCILLCGHGVSVCGGNYAGRNLQKRPSRRQVLVEKGVSALYGMVEDTMGKHNSYWTPYIGALFLSSICGSYIGMTGDIPFGNSGPVHHRDLGTDDQLPVLGVFSGPMVFWDGSRALPNPFWS